MYQRFAVRGWLAAAVLSGGLVSSLVSLGVLAGMDCDSLSEPETPAVDYESQIQAIFNINCISCHSPGGPGHVQTGLDLRTGESYDLLVGVDSTQPDGGIRVEPFEPENSLLFLKVNCNDPPAGERMPPGSQLPSASQALIRDWIKQGALEEPPPVDSFSIGGTVSGLAGAGLVLQNNGGDNLSMSSNDPFTFTTELEDGQPYNVTVFQQPSNPSQTCIVSNGSGTVSGADVTDVEVTCVTDTFTIGGTVSALEGEGLVLQNNGADDLAITSDGPFTFDSPMDDGSSYDVTVSAHPGSPQQTCTVSNGSGTVSGSEVTDVVVECETLTFTLGGTVSMLEGSDLVLQNNGGDDLPIAEDGPFTFATGLPQGSGYEVTVFVQPDNPEQFCVVRRGTGVMPAADVDNIEVECFDQDPDVFEDRFEVQ